MYAMDVRDGVKHYRPIAVGVVLTSRFDSCHLGVHLRADCAVYIVL